MRAKSFSLWQPWFLSHGSRCEWQDRISKLGKRKRQVTFALKPLLNPTTPQDRHQSGQSALFYPSSYGFDDSVDFIRIFFKCALRKAFRTVEVEKEIKKVLRRKRLDWLSFQQRQLASCPSTQSLNPRMTFIGIDGTCQSRDAR
jgi:hypothetical protein